MSSVTSVFSPSMASQNVWWKKEPLQLFYLTVSVKAYVISDSSTLESIFEKHWMEGQNEGRKICSV